MKISLHDHTYNRAILAQVPEYLANSNHSGDEIAEAIATALGIRLSECEWMIGEFDARIDAATYNENGVPMYQVGELSQGFKEDALAAINHD